MNSDIKLNLLQEGKIHFLAPDLRFYSKNEKIDPAWAPVFYNPAMKVSRDISVALIDAYAKNFGRSSIRICEPLSATGVRGLRYAAELDVAEEVIINDKNKNAYYLEIKNILYNSLAEKVKVFNRDARALLYDFAERNEKFDVVDIDPFGSPTPFVEAALSVLKHKGLLLLTATDLAPLFGVNPGACRRKYFATPILSEFSKETGARILAAFTVREAAKIGLAAKPIFTALVRHSLRLAFIVERNKGLARRSVELIGYVTFCPRCMYRTLTTETLLERLKCPSCGSYLTVGGPLWVDKLWDNDLCQTVLQLYKSREYLDEKGLRIVELIANEADKPCLYTTVTTIARIAALKEEPSPLDLVNKVLKAGGSASLTHFDSKGFRVNLQPSEVITIVNSFEKC